MTPRENAPQVDPARVKAVATELALTGPLTVERMAAHLGTSPRSLQRHMAHQGVSLRQMVDECRLGVARILISKTDLSIREIARRTGYATSGGLARAFARWSGCSPSAYRKAIRRLPPDNP